MATYTKEFVSYNNNSGGTIGTTSTDYINFTVGEHTGRNSRQSSFEIKGYDITASENSEREPIYNKSFTVTQTGNPCYLHLSQTELTCTNESGIIVIGATSNSDVLTISCDDSDIQNKILSNAIIQINSTTSINYPDHSSAGNKIPDDPGAIKEYSIVFFIPITENPDKTKKRTLRYSIGYNSSSFTSQVIKVTQGEDYILNVTPETLTFDYNGGTKSVSIESNVDWTIS